MTTLLALGLAMAGGLALSRVMKLFNLPNVTGYLIAGLLIGPYVLGLVTEANVQATSAVTTVALGFIAFSIGGEFKFEYLKKLGGKILVITVLQAVMAVVLVIGALLLIPGEHRVSLALLLGAIAAATAPAATLMVVRQFRAKGPVTDTLLPVVALDDAIGLMIFSVCFALAKTFESGAELTFAATVWSPLREIGLSLVIGAALGGLLALMCRFFHSRDNRLCLMIAAVVLGVALSELLDLSSLLVCMMLGALFANLRKDSLNILEGSERWTPPLFMLFFVLSGADLNISVLPTVGLVGLLYLLCRSMGKYFGARLGATLVHADTHVRKYLGITLLPQAGVAIGMAQLVSASPELANVAPQVVAVTLAATLVYELVGPVLTKVSLEKAGEIDRGSGRGIPLVEMIRKAKSKHTAQKPQA